MKTFEKYIKLQKYAYNSKLIYVYNFIIMLFRFCWTVLENIISKEKIAHVLILHLSPNYQMTEDVAYLLFKLWLHNILKEEERKQYYSITILYTNTDPTILSPNTDNHNCAVLWHRQFTASQFSFVLSSYYQWPLCHVLIF